MFHEKVLIIYKFMVIENLKKEQVSLSSSFVLSPQSGNYHNGRGGPEKSK